jgi:hypothetical protein
MIMLQATVIVLQPMSMAPRDREIFVMDRDGDQVIAQWSAGGEYAVDEPATAGGYSGAS